MFKYQNVKMKLPLVICHNVEPSRSLELVPLWPRGDMRFNHD